MKPKKILYLYAIGSSGRAEQTDASGNSGRTDAAGNSGRIDAGKSSGNNFTGTNGMVAAWRPGNYIIVDKKKLFNRFLLNKIYIQAKHKSHLFTFTYTPVN